MNLCNGRDIGISQAKHQADMARAFMQSRESSRSGSVKRQHAARKKRQHTVSQSSLKCLTLSTTRQSANAIEQFRDIDRR